ncbi:Rieske (2Fe-2S) protein [Sphingobacterium sp. UT-1RO-CII-1]|uniref:Rieske (2Fe-2S) protein n=1 Tax=Sphingobacterium sp. UT-1RO-CII-1 TaxID=2995225 RepID=UPI00227AE85C|nr:Rieske (2Fe-2S) protein [Sphingobacterium sp. UT-1RO-CII-1]MCY4781237.1 Rieske (2Fe-2S) protein [Sphingobacterium sp. UT-1RO-CII-1]
MNRKYFLKQCGLACLSSSIATALFNSCVTQKAISGQLVNTDLVIPLDSFLVKNKTTDYKKYIIVEHKQLQHPIYVFRFSENEYSALLMRCTHQGAELQAFGDVLECPAHGSEFNNRGIVQNGPANKNLRTFPVISTNNELKISLKNV